MTTLPAARRALLATLLAALPLLAACVDRTVAPRAHPAQLGLALDAAGVSAAVPKGSLAVTVFYRRDDATTGTPVTVLSIALQSDALGSMLPVSFDPRCARQGGGGTPAAGCQVTVPIQIDIGDCLADPRRRPAGQGCPLFATGVLRDSTSRVVAEATIGPVRAIPGQAVTVPAITLPLRSAAP